MSHSHSHASASQPFLPRSNLFNYNHRKVKDFEWYFAYLVAIIATIGGGVYAFLKRNTMFESMTTSSFNDPRLCPYGSLSLQRRLLQDPTPKPFDIDVFLHSAASWIGVSAAGALLLGLVFVGLVRHHARLLVFLALTLQVAAPIVAGFFMMSAGNNTAAVIFFVSAAVIFFSFLLWSPQIEMVTGLLGAAGRGLSANPGLAPTSLGCVLVMIVLEAPLALACLAAYMNGTLVYNPERGDKGKVITPGMCKSKDSKDPVSCCVWKVDPWVPGYLTVASIVMFWTLMIAFQVRLYTVAGAIAQWYFSGEDGVESFAHNFAGEDVAEQGVAIDPSGHVVHVKTHNAARRSSCGGRTSRSLGHAMGPSFGSICKAGGLLTLCSLARKVMERIRRERESSLLMACLAAVVECFISLVEYVSKFATIYAAISGESWSTAGRHVIGLLYRNGLDAYGVWWLPPMVLHSCCATMSIAWGVVVWALSRNAAAFKAQGPAAAVLMGAMAFFACWVVLSFFGNLLLNIVDTLFVCFGMDRESRVVSRVDVHELYSHLPSVGAIVQNPDGTVAYGAPATVPEHVHSHYCDHYAPQAAGGGVGAHHAVAPAVHPSPPMHYHACAAGHSHAAQPVVHPGAMYGGAVPPPVPGYPAMYAPPMAPAAPYPPLTVCSSGHVHQAPPPGAVPSMYGQPSMPPRGYPYP